MHVGSELSAGELWYWPPFPLSQTPVHSPVWFRFRPSDPERPLYSFTLVMSFASLSLVLFPELPLFGWGSFGQSLVSLSLLFHAKILLTLL